MAVDMKKYLCVKCPKCAARAGKPCRNEVGRKCHPHSLRRARCRDIGMDARVQGDLGFPAAAQRDGERPEGGRT